MIRALIVDDEPPARREMRKLLSPYDDVQIVGEADCAEDAKRLVGELQPNVVFLDIQMPGVSGLELAGSMTDTELNVVFVTAYDAHAIQAFDLNAVDYLLKPVEPSRLARTLDRLRHGQVDEAATETVLSENDRIFLRSPERSWFTPVQSIYLLQSEGNYTRVFFDAEKPLISRSLQALGQRLPAHLFFRANRSQIINIHSIISTEDWFSGCLKVKLRDGTEVELSRRQSQIFRDQFGL